MVNIEYVKSYVNGRGGELEMTNGDFVKVARSQKKEIISRLIKS
jgi:hypothetical protein